MIYCTYKNISWINCYNDTVTKIKFKKIYKKYPNTLNILQQYNYIYTVYMCFYFKFVFQGSSSLCQSKETWHRDQDSTGQRLAVLSTNNAMVEASGRLQHSSQGNIIEESILIRDVSYASSMRRFLFRTSLYIAS